MAKATPLTSADLTARRTKAKSATPQRGAAPSADLVPLQFKMPPDFVREFKQAALDHDMKLNALLAACFQEFMKSGK